MTFCWNLGMVNYQFNISFVVRLSVEIRLGAQTQRLHQDRLLQQLQHVGLLSCLPVKHCMISMLKAPESSALKKGIPSTWKPKLTIIGMKVHWMEERDISLSRMSLCWCHCHKSGISVVCKSFISMYGECYSVKNVAFVRGIVKGA